MVSRPGGRGIRVELLNGSSERLLNAGVEEGRDSTGQRCWLTASRGNPKESATENRPPMAQLLGTGKGETVR